MTTPLRPRTDLRTRLRLWAVSHDVESFDVDPHGKLMTSEAVVDELLAAIVADETDAERVARYGREQREAELANAALAAPAAGREHWTPESHAMLDAITSRQAAPAADGLELCPHCNLMRQPSREPGEEG